MVHGGRLVGCWREQRVRVVRVRRVVVVRKRRFMGVFFSVISGCLFLFLLLLFLGGGGEEWYSGFLRDVSGLIGGW